MAELSKKILQQEQELGVQKRRAEFFRNKSENLEHENTLLRERREEEAKKKVGIHMTK